MAVRSCALCERRWRTRQAIWTRRLCSRVRTLSSGYRMRPGTEEEILSRIEKLVGAYLNAARLGQNALEEAVRANAPESAVEHNGILVFNADVEPEARATLDAFGVSADGYELFPFNAAAIDQMSHEGCSQNGRLVYNPRFVIQNVVTTVLNHRDSLRGG